MLDQADGTHPVLILVEVSPLSMLMVNLMIARSRQDSLVPLHLLQSFVDLVSLHNLKLTINVLTIIQLHLLTSRTALHSICLHLENKPSARNSGYFLNHILSSKKPSYGNMPGEAGSCVGERLETWSRSMSIKLVESGTSLSKLASSR